MGKGKGKEKGKTFGKGEGKGAASVPAKGKGAPDGNKPPGTVQQGPNGVQVVTMDDGWVKIVQPDGKPPYYHHPKTNVTQWSPPATAANANGSHRAMNDALQQVRKAGQSVVDTPAARVETSTGGGGMSLAPPGGVAPTQGYKPKGRSEGLRPPEKPPAPVPEGPKGDELQAKLDAIQKEALDRRAAAVEEKKKDEEAARKAVESAQKMKDAERQQEMLELQRSQQQKQMLLTDGAGGPGSPGKSAASPPAPPAPPMAPAMPAPKRPTGAAAVGQKRVFSADTEAPAEGYLAAKRGETVEVLHYEGKWYYGKTTSSAGWFPIDNVE